jgi:hypothetical protein
VVNFFLLFISMYRDLLGQLADAMPQTVEVTPEEREALERVNILSFLFQLSSVTSSSRL